MTTQEAIKLAVDNGYNPQRIFDNREFWIAFGKGLGWDRMPWPDVWLSYRHQFKDHLAEGKDIESFFSQLE